MLETKKKHSIENRGAMRTALRAEVKFSHPDVGDLKLHTGNISDDGAYILAEGNRVPCVGELIAVQVQGMGAGDAPVVNMRIVRIDKEGMGLVFVKDEEIVDGNE